jgi:cyclomaltodextrinase
MKKLNFMLLVVFVLTLTSNNSAQLKGTKTGDNQFQWAEGIVWYQIFPERFFNGDPDNDPTMEEVPHADRQPGWQIHPWTSDWYKLQPWELNQSNYFYDVVFQRRYGGDLAGVINKLDYLKKLGIGGIYFNPVFEAKSLHKYDGSSYHHIDDNFGSNPTADKKRLEEANETEDPATWIWTSADSVFLELIKEAHKRDIKIVIDGVFNHTGQAFFAFKDIRKNQANSKYANWYDVISWDNPETPENEFDFKGWWGYKGLPELAENDSGIVHGPREYIFNATRRWLDPDGDGDPSDGIDGWRLDVASEVAKPFWIEWNALVKSINPGAITVAEIWDDAADWVNSGCFDGTMNYLFAKAAVKYFINSDSSKAFINRMDTIQAMYKPETIPILWSMLDSHDTDRIASMIKNPGRAYDKDARPSETNDYNVEKPDDWERQLQKIIAAFQLTYTGAPVIYYGTEAGMWGADDPDDRKPMLWEEFTYEDEKTYPIPGRTRKADKNVFDQDLFEFYQKLIWIHNKYEVFKKGSIEFLDIPLQDVFGFIRRNENELAIVIINKGDSTQVVNFERDKIDATALINIWTGKEIVIGNIQPEIEIAGRDFFILVNK